ncbi:MAG: Rieske (2Fe-2S) protein [Actinobacteria bacterium]|nr:Rieske (2Fe-2S) protein [Actinomycetota bacterium]
MSSHVTTERVVALPLADLPPGTSTTVKAFGTTVAVFNVEGRVFAVGNNCPHHGGPLWHGRISGTCLPSRPHEYRYGREGRVLTCPWHGWEFDVESGRALFDPSVRAKVYEARVEHGQIVLTRRRSRRPS